MKNQPIIMLSMIGAIAFASITARTVKAPEYDTAPFNFRIAAIHLSDTATRIDADIYQRPNWWVKADSNIYLESRITRKTYPLQRVEGMPIGKEVFAGDSAHIRATFIFGALAPVDSVFDFCDEDWTVRGINPGYRPNGIVTHISGTLHDKPSYSWLYLMPKGEDLRVNKSVIIPVENGRFEYDLVTSDTLAYEISVGMEMLEGSWINNPFFAEGVPVYLDMNFENGESWERIKGGSLTERLLQPVKEMMDIYHASGVAEERERLDSLKQFYTPEVYDIYDLIGKEEIGSARRDSLLNKIRDIRNSGKDLSPAGTALEAKWDSVNGVMSKRKLQFMEDDGTLAGLSTIKDQIIFRSKDMDKALDIFRRVYADRYADHPYSLFINQILADEKVEKGSHYPDFSAPDLEGNMHQLSDLINGKYALIDLWASWCGPCRRHSREIVPVYENWKDRGFTVVGIAREKGNTSAMEQAIERDGYPWLNLVELNDAHNIWARYMAGNAGGKTVLVDPTGIILAIDPEAGEVEEILRKNLD